MGSAPQGWRRGPPDCVLKGAEEVAAGAKEDKLGSRAKAQISERETFLGSLSFCHSEELEAWAGGRQRDRGDVLIGRALNTDYSSLAGGQSRLKSSEQWRALVGLHFQKTLRRCLFHNGDRLLRSHPVPVPCMLCVGRAGGRVLKLTMQDPPFLPLFPSPLQP